MNCPLHHWSMAQISLMINAIGQVSHAMFYEVVEYALFRVGNTRHDWRYIQ